MRTCSCKRSSIQGWPSKNCAYVETVCRCHVERHSGHQSQHLWDSLTIRKGLNSVSIGLFHAGLMKVGLCSSQLQDFPPETKKQTSDINSLAVIVLRKAFEFCLETISKLFQQSYVLIILPSQVAEKDDLQIFRVSVSIVVENVPYFHIYIRGYLSNPNLHLSLSMSFPSSLWRFLERIALLTPSCQDFWSSSSSSLGWSVSPYLLWQPFFGHCLKALIP